MAADYYNAVPACLPDWGVLFRLYPVIKPKYVAAAIQLSAGGDKEKNFKLAASSAKEAREQGAALVVLPELFSWRGLASAEPGASEPIPGPTSQFLAELAKSLEIVLVGGSFLEKSGVEGKAFNTCLVFDPQGRLVARYRKLHLFDVDIPGQVVVRESERRIAGEKVVTCETECGKLGLAICYDLRFPELFLRLASAGVELVCMPSAFTFPTGEAHWETLIRARAIENQVYVVAANQIGAGATGIADYGNSLIADPWGRIMARASDSQRVVAAEISQDYLQRVREELPCRQHRRLDL